MSPKKKVLKRDVFKVKSVLEFSDLSEVVTLR